MHIRRLIFHTKCLTSEKKLKMVSLSLKAGSYFDKISFLWPTNPFFQLIYRFTIFTIYTYDFLENEKK